MPLASGAQLGFYRITSLIGQSGMGEVYHARDSRLGRDVAIKVRLGHLADPQSMTRFEHEAKAVAALARQTDRESEAVAKSNTVGPTATQSILQTYLDHL
jgi:serine/threonine protein kinase